MPDDETGEPGDRLAGVRAAVAGSRLWREVDWVDSTPSTQAGLAARARDGQAGGVVLVTGHQVAGRGRLDRTWVTPPGVALTFSLLLDPHGDGVDVARWPWLPLLTGLALDDAVASAAGLPDGVAHGLKWPNDLLVGAAGDERKAAGILAERVEVSGGDARGRGARAVIGCGLNVHTTAADLPVVAATSLALVGARDLDPPGTGHPRLLAAFLRAFERRYLVWTAAGGDAATSGLVEEYRAQCLTLGRRVRVELPGGGSLHGTAADVDASGRLVVEGEGGGRRALGAGDVVHVRVP